MKDGCCHMAKDQKVAGVDLPNARPSRLVCVGALLHPTLSWQHSWLFTITPKQRFRTPEHDRQEDEEAEDRH
jgi:hypothetical protein